MLPCRRAKLWRKALLAAYSVCESLGFPQSWSYPFFSVMLPLALGRSVPTDKTAMDEHASKKQRELLNLRGSRSERCAGLARSQDWNSRLIRERTLARLSTQVTRFVVSDAETRPRPTAMRHVQ